MARNGVSDSEVREAIEALQAEGGAVTMTGIRDRLGTGSYGTISRILFNWREEQKSVKQPLTPDPPEVVSALMRRLWEEAYGAAEKQHDAEREAFAQQQAQYRRTEKELLDAITALENKAQQLESANSNLSEELARTLDGLKAANLKLDSARDDLTRTVAASDNLREQLDDALKRAASEEANAVAAYKSVAKLESQLDRANQDHKKLCERMESARDGLSAANLKLDSLQDDVKRATAAKDKLRQELDEALKRAASEEANVAAAQKNESKLEAQLERAHQDHKDLSERMESWIERATKAETKLKGTQK